MIRFWLFSGVIITLGSLLGLIFTSKELHHLDDIKSTLIQLPIIDESIYFSMMMLHSGTTNNFDALTELNHRQIQTSQQLFNKLEYHFKDRYKKNVQDIASILAIKENQLEKFKSNIALLNNAKFYVTTKMQVLSTDDQKQLPIILKISSNLLKFSESPKLDTANQIRQDIVKVNTALLSDTGQSHWHHALLHMEYYLKNKLDAFNFSLLTVNWATLPPYRSLKDKINNHHNRYSVFQTLTYSTLTLGIISLISLAAVIFSRYLNARQDLVTLNQSLETRIELATQDLEKSRDIAIKANAAKTSFLANMSHELRTPLNSIIGFSSRLEKKLAKSEEKSVLSALKNIRTNGHYLLNFFNDLLELSRESQEEEEDIKPINIEINELCRGAITNVSNYFYKKSVELIFNVEQQVSICSQENRIKRIIYGVTNTAMHNTDSGFVKLDLETVEGGCRFTVTDSGTPLTEERIEVLLNPLDNSQTDSINVQGIGLGLYLVNKMLNLIEGSIEIVPQASGNEYRIFLPSC